MKKIWLNNRLVPDTEAKVSIWDRGFIYGDGVYETVRLYQQKLFRTQEHWQRLDQSLKGIELKIPWSHHYIHQACIATAKANHLMECFVRITIPRGSGEVGIMM